MKVLWICGLPNAVRLTACDRVLSLTPTAAWSWVLGHLPPPKDVELHIVCPVGGLYAPRVDFEYKGAQWHCFRRYRFELPLLWLRFYWQIRSFVKELSPDVIHGWGGETGCGWIATLLTSSAVVSVQGLLRWFEKLLSEAGAKSKFTISSWLQGLIEKATYRRAAICLVESEASRRGLLKYYGQKSVLVHHPLRREFIDASIPLENLSALGVVNIVFVGSLTERKGAVDALRAFSEVAETGTHLSMIGEGLLRQQLETVIAENGLNGKVELLGTLSVDKILEVFKTAQLFLLPSYGDTGPTALKEALASGLYPICYDNSGPRDLISHYGCGSLCTTGDIKQLVSTLRTCLMDVQHYRQMAISVAEKVRDELSCRTVWRELEEVYRNVIARK